jgi:DNA ligase (NAD+)
MSDPKELEKLIKYHNRKYFIDNAPEISDEEFDKLTKELKSIDPNSPVLYELVGDIGDVTHPKPMLSLEKRYTHDEIIKWIENIKDDSYIVEPKYDGMAARYQNGILATRGDGYRGENISHRLKELNIKGTLPINSDISIYGEVIIPLNYFNDNLKNTYKNPRNAVVGIIKAKEVKPEGIKALLEGGVHLVLHDQAKKLEVKSDEILNQEKWESLLEEMFHSEYPLDGIVIKAITPTIKEKLGATAHHEKWQVAYKSPAERKITIVKEIKHQVGRTGRITSVAVVEPVELSGATVQNVTLHNYKYVQESGINIGSEIEICRSGEVIPFITRVFTAKSPQGATPIPTHCPVCSAEVIQHAKYLECPNKNCPAKLSQSIEYFFKTLDVEELGLKTIEKFINEFKLKSIIDFYKLKPEQISELDGFGEKSATKIIKNIQNTLNQTITPEDLISALGIKEIGYSTSTWIINHFGFEKLPSLTIEDLQQVKGLGSIKAEYFVKNLKDKWEIVKNLQKMGLKFKSKKRSDLLKGRTFAITGKKETYSRDELIEIIKENGGEYKTSITKDLDYLIAGEDAGSKLEKAEELEIKIITEKELLNMI